MPLRDLRSTVNDGTVIINSDAFDGLGLEKAGYLTEPGETRGVTSAVGQDRSVENVRPIGQPGWDCPTECVTGRDASTALSYGACCQGQGETRGAGQAREIGPVRDEPGILVPRPDREPARVVPPAQ